MTTKLQRHFWIVLLTVFAITLAACAPAITSVPTETPIPTAIFTTAPPTFTPTATFVFPTPSPIPTHPPPPIFTPDAIQVERWKEYQTELAKALFSPEIPQNTYGPEEYKNALCEWDILGRTDQEVYVWAMCRAARSFNNFTKGLGVGVDISAAVIYLEPDGSIRKVNMLSEIGHGASWHYVLDIFPVDIQEKLCLYYFEGMVPQCSDITPAYAPSHHVRLDALALHLGYRETHAEEPPLVVLSTMLTATPKP